MKKLECIIKPFPLLFGALGTAVGMTPVFWTMAATLLAGAYYAREVRKS